MSSKVLAAMGSLVRGVKDLLRNTKAFRTSTASV
jgi:hypothetical protein